MEESQVWSHHDTFYPMLPIKLLGKASPMIQDNCLFHLPREWGKKYNKG